MKKNKKQIPKFLLILILSTVVIVGAIGAIGINFRGKKNTHVEEYQRTSGVLKRMQSIPGGASTETVQLMSDDMASYEETLMNLEAAVVKSTGVKFTNVAEAKFAANVSKAHKEMKAKFDEAGVQLPSEWYLGFEKYKSVPAPKSITGKLGYSLEAITFLHEELLKVEPHALLNLRRVEITDEVTSGGGKRKKGAKAAKAISSSNSDVVSQMPIEITFVAKESNIRKFLNNLTRNDQYIFTIDTIKLESISGERYKKNVAVVEEKKPEVAAADVLETSSEIDDEITYSSEKKFEQVLGDESVIAYLDLNLVHFAAKPKKAPLKKKK